MNLPREFVRMPDRCQGQINWHSDRAEIIADGVVHAIGACLGLVGDVTIVVMAVKIERINVAPILVYVIILSRAPTSRISGPSRKENSAAIRVSTRGGEGKPGKAGKRTSQSTPPGRALLSRLA